MKKLSLLAILFILLMSCKKNNTEAEGTFTITKVGGSSVTLKYVASTYLLKKNNFYLEYQNLSDGGKYYFTLLGDYDTDGLLDIIIPQTVQNNITYTTVNSLNREVSFYGLFFGTEVNVGTGRTEVVFENSRYPGRIKGYFKKYNNSTITHIGNFDFIAK